MSEAIKVLAVYLAALAALSLLSISTASTEEARRRWLEKAPSHAPKSWGFCD